jgi:RNA recognition motif-containing protein
MAKRLFIGSLPYDATTSQLEELFSQAGKVESVNVITDRYTGRGKGFAFVEMATEEEAQKAIKMLNGHDLNGRAIVVNEARPQEDRSQRGSYSRPKRW